MLVGRHGIGKSQIITEHYRERGMKVVAFFLGQMSDPGDLIGLLHKDESTGRSEFLPPYWWPEAERRTDRACSWTNSTAPGQRFCSP